jgi:helix-turn-helix protein
MQDSERAETVILTLGQAARHCGVSKGTISKAIASGKLSATRREDGSWAIDGAELTRYLDVNGHRFRSETGSSEQPETIADLRARAELAEQRLGDLKAMLEDMRRQRDDAERQRDKWETVATRLSLSAPKPDEQPTATPTQSAEQPSRFRRAWRWMRATGCLAGAGLLLALSTVPAGAQQQPPQQQQQPGCFTVEMSHSTQGNPQGSILLDRCTGKTWLLLCIRNDTAGCAFRWAPIPDATEPAGGP